MVDPTGSMLGAPQGGRGLMDLTRGAAGSGAFAVEGDCKQWWQKEEGMPGAWVEWRRPWLPATLKEGWGRGASKGGVGRQAGHDHLGSSAYREIGGVF